MSRRVFAFGMIVSVWTWLDGWNQGLHAFTERDQTIAIMGLTAATFALIGTVLLRYLPMVSLALFSMASLLSLGAATQGYSQHWVYLLTYIGMILLSYKVQQAKDANKSKRLIEAAHEQALAYVSKSSSAEVGDQNVPGQG